MGNVIQLDGGWIVEIRPTGDAALPWVPAFGGDYGETDEHASTFPTETEARRSMATLALAWAGSARELRVRPLGPEQSGSWGFAAVGDDGLRPVVWGLGATEAAALEDAADCLAEVDATSDLNLHPITAEERATIEAGDVRWPVERRALQRIPRAARLLSLHFRLLGNGRRPSGSRRVEREDPPAVPFAKGGTHKTTWQALELTFSNPRAVAGSVPRAVVVDVEIRQPTGTTRLGYVELVPLFSKPHGNVHRAYHGRGFPAGERGWVSRELLAWIEGLSGGGALELLHHIDANASFVALCADHESEPTS